MTCSVCGPRNGDNDPLPPVATVRFREGWWEHHRQTQPLGASDLSHIRGYLGRAPQTRAFAQHLRHTANFSTWVRVRQKRSSVNPPPPLAVLFSTPIELIVFLRAPPSEAAMRGYAASRSG